MINLNKHLEEQLKTVPNLLLRQAVIIKLEEQGIEGKRLLDALTDHIFSGSEETFHWDDGGHDQTRNLHIELTDEDTKKIEEDYNRFIKESLPEIIKNSLQDGAKSLAKELEKRWPEQKVEERNSIRHFRDRLDLRWAKGLDPLQMMLIASREVGQEFAEKLARSKAKKGIVKREVIMALHMRACQTTMEILTLLENGLSDGAYARWRTLYEISVVALVIDLFGDVIAERYLAHDVVSMRESIINEFKHDEQNYDPATLKGEAKEIEDEFQSLVEEFGKSFAGPYGWVAHCFGMKRPRFQDLEEAIDWNALPPNYKWSSYKVHAGVAGTVRSLGSFGGQPVIHAGASNAGLETPAINTAYSLMQVTSLVFGKSNDLETQIKMQSLVLLRNKVVRECRKAAKKLESDEMEIRLGLAEL